MRMVILYFQFSFYVTQSCYIALSKMLNMLNTVARFEYKAFLKAYASTQYLHYPAV